MIFRLFEMETLSLFKVQNGGFHLILRKDLISFSLLLIGIAFKNSVELQICLRNVKLGIDDLVPKFSLDNSWGIIDVYVLHKEYGLICTYLENSQCF